MEVHVDAWMKPLEVRHPRNEPLGGEGARRRDPHLRSLARLRQSLERRLERIEALAQNRKERCSRLRQRHLADLPLEQRKSELLLQRPDLVADRRRGDGEFGRGALEAPAPGGRLEGAKATQGREPATSFKMSLAHPSPEKSEFVGHEDCRHLSSIEGVDAR